MNDNNHASVLDADAIQAAKEAGIRNARRPIRDVIVAEEVPGIIPDSFLFQEA